MRLRPERAKIFCLCALQLSWRKLCTQKNRRNSPAGEIERCTKNTIFFVSFARTAVGSKTDLQIWHFFCAKSRYRRTGVIFFVKKCRNFDQKTRNFIIQNSTRAVRASKHPPLFHKSPRGPRTRGAPPHHPTYTNIQIIKFLFALCATSLEGNFWVRYWPPHFV